MVLRKKETYTVITPIPGFIPRQLAIDILHSHSEFITLNPLVIGHKQIQAPRDAPSDEFFSTWYEITQRLQVVPGVGRLGAGTIKFNGCFHDLPWGLQTHIYAPFNIDMRSKFRVGGNQPGVEPPEPQEIGLGGLGAPKDGLYLREDIEFKCNISLVAVVRAQMKAASKEMVERIIKKAELLDAGVLSAMIENGKLRTVQPGQAQDYTGGLRAAAMNTPPPLSPSSPGYPAAPGSPPCQQSSPSVPYQVPRPVSLQQQSRPAVMNNNGQGMPSPSYPYPQSQQPYHPSQNPLYAQNKVQQYAVEMAANEYPNPHALQHASPQPQVTQHQSQQYTSELPGDAHWQQPPQPLQLGQQNQNQHQHPLPLHPGQPQQAWSQPQPSPALSQYYSDGGNSNPGSRRQSYSTTATSDVGSPAFPPPGDQKVSGSNFAAMSSAGMLPTHREGAE